MSSDFDELFSDKKKKKKRQPDWNKGIPTPEVHPEPLPTPVIVDEPDTLMEPAPPIVRPAVAPIREKRKKTPKIDVREVTRDIISELGKQLPDLVKNAVKSSIPDPSKPSAAVGDLIKIINDQGLVIGSYKGELEKLKPLSPRIWNELNRFNFMQTYSRPDKKGLKAVEMFTHFGSEQVTWSDVTLYIQEMRKLGLLRRNRDGWFKMTPKGRKHHQDLLDARNNK